MRYKLRNNVLIKNEKSGLLVTRKGSVTTIENVMYPVFIDREEELQFEKIANMCMDREVNRDIILSKA